MSIIYAKEIKNLHLLFTLFHFSLVRQIQQIFEMYLSPFHVDVDMNIDIYNFVWGQWNYDALIYTKPIIF